MSIFGSPPSIRGDVLGPLSKSVTFTGAANLGQAASATTYFTVTGQVEIITIVPYCVLTLVDGTNTATVSLGVTGIVELFIAATQSTLLATDEMWDGTSPTDKAIAIPAAFKNIAISDDIIVDCLTENTDGGALRIDLYWRPLSSDGLVVAA